MPRYTAYIFFTLLMCGCAPSASSLSSSSFGGQSFSIHNSLGYEQVWNATNRAISKGFTVLESHKQTGVIKAKYNNSDRVVGIFIDPTVSHADSYRLYMITKNAFLSDADDLGWDPILLDDIYVEMGKGS